jgi:hypothetical protein
MPFKRPSTIAADSALRCRLRLAAAAVLALATSWPASAAAQAFRCDVNGRVTFQQAPCHDGRRVADGAPAAPATAVPRGAGLCEAHVRTSGAFVDPESLRIAAVRFVGAKAWRVHDELIAARTYSMRINARNEQGGYDGEKLFECLLSEDEARVLHFARAGTTPAAAAAPR